MPKKEIRTYDKASAPIVTRAYEFADDGEVRLISVTREETEALARTPVPDHRTVERSRTAFHKENPFCALLESRGIDLRGDLDGDKILDQIEADIRRDPNMRTVYRAAFLNAEARSAAKGKPKIETTPHSFVTSAGRDHEHRAPLATRSVDQEKSFDQRRAETMAHIRKGQPRGPRAPELISRMSEREVYDLRDVRVDPYGRDDSEVINRARRAVDLADFPTARDQEAAKDHIDRLLLRHDQNWNPGGLARRILNTGSEAYRRCLQKMVRAAFAGMEPGAYLDRDETRLVTHAMTIGSSPSGGFAVNYQLDPTIVPVSNGSVNPFRAACRVELISGTEWRQPTSTGLTLTYQAEAAASTDTSPALGQSAILTNRVQGFVPTSEELAADWDGMESELGRLISSAKDDLEAVQFATGAGTTVFPQGLITGATTTVNGSAGAFAVADLFALEAALPGRFRQRAQLFANRVHLRNIQKFNTTGGADIWVQDQVQGLGNFGGKVLGYPANEASGMVSTVTTGSKIVALGDPQYYAIIDAVGLDLEIIPHIFDSATGFPKGQRGVYILYRNSAAVLNANAFRVLITT
jgi:HK97 family phage major capsid protein